MKNGGKNASQICVVLMLAVSVAAAVAAAPGAGTAPGAEAAANASRATLASKLRLVKLLLAQSPALQRIPQSGNAVAKKKLAEAQVLFAKAQTEAGPEAAIALLDESLLRIAAASRLVPDAAQLAAQERSRNAQLREAIAIFQKQQRNLSARAPHAQPSAELAQLDSLVARADALASGGEQHEANLLLNKAYRTVVLALNSMLAAQTIVYDLKFASPNEEFKYELARNRSYDELIPIALAQLRTAHETAALAQGYVSQSRALRDTAQQQASGGDLRSAVKSVQDATNYLQRSLRIAGLVVAQSPESQP